MGAKNQMVFSKMMPTFSLLHATYGRPEKAAAAMRMALDRANDRSRIEYIFAVNSGDKSYIDLIQKVARVYVDLGVMPSFVMDNFAGSAPAWDAAAKASSGDVLVQMQDDLELPADWDMKILAKLYEFENYWDTNETPIFVAVSDGFRADALCCTAIMTRARYEQQREFLHAGYPSVFSDDEVTYRAYRDQRDGKCTVIEARDLVFLHRHHYHDKSVPMDATYERENSSEAYQIGSELFVKRNPEAFSDGIRTWH